MNVVYHRLFQRDINTAVRYYDGEGGQLLGDRLFDEIERTVGRVISRPTAFHFIAPGFRRANLKSFPYHLIYEESPTSIKFLILRHHRRHPSYGLRRK